MSIRNLDEAEAAVREVLQLEDPRAQLRKMPTLIASCLDAESREFLEGAQRRISERAGTRIIRKPVVIPPDPDTTSRPAPAPPPSRGPEPQRDPEPEPLPDPDEHVQPVFVADPYANTEPEPADIPKPKPTPQPEPEPVPAASGGATDAPKPSVPKLNPFSAKSKPKPAAGGPTLRTNDPSLIAAELLSADDPDAKPLPAFTSRRAERTDVVTLLGEADIIDENAGAGGDGGASARTSTETKPGSVRRERPRALPKPEREPEPAPQTARAGSAELQAMADGLAGLVDDADDVDDVETGEIAGETPAAETLSAGDTLPEGTILSPPTRVIPRPGGAPATEVEAVREAEPEPEPDPDPLSDPALTLPPDTVFTDELPDTLPELSIEAALEAAPTSDQPKAFTREQAKELPPDLLAKLGSAETIQPDTVFHRDPPIAAPDDRDRGTEFDDEFDDDEFDDDDDDILELDADAIMEAGTPPTVVAADPELDMGTLLASLPPMPDELDDAGAAGDNDSDNDIVELGAAAVLTMPDDDTAPAIVATPIPSGERDPEEVFDSIELALRTGTLPLEAGREGLSDDEAGSLFQAFLSTDADAARAADPTQVGEDTIVMDKPSLPAPPTVVPGAGDSIDAVALYRVIRRIFDETHQKLPTWLIARTIMREPTEVFQLVLDALQLRQARDFIGYKETVADLFQRILTTRLKHGKDIESIERWLRRKVLVSAPEDGHERLETAIDAVLISDRRLAEARGYKERGREGIRAAVSLLESLAADRHA